MKTYEKILNFVLPVVTVAIIVCAWAVAAKATANSLIMPTVSETFAKTFSLFSSKEFYAAYFGTLLRTLAAFAFCFAVALATAILSYKYELAERALLPLVVIVRVLPTVAVVLILVLWTNSRTAAIAVTSLVVFPTLYENLYASFKRIDDDLIEMCKVFGIKRRKVFSKVILPSVAPDAIAAAGAGITLDLKLMVAAEVLAHTPASLGFLLNTSKEYFETAEMTALVLITVVTGLLIGLIFWRLSAKARKGV